VAGLVSPDDRSHWTTRYYRDRQRVLGRHAWVSEDPELAGEELAARFGGAARARAWLRQVLAHLERWSR
jgi:hypothetical protein